EFIWGNQVGQPFTLSNQSEELAAVKVYPNPSQNGVFYINGITEPTQYSVTDLLGRSIMKQQSLLTGGAITIQSAAGTYILQLSNAHGERNIKLIVN
ncbi:MAG: T9SS type A sorting domain-containing protein, partial [Nonlabens sp.]|nr:T9SS type A sorting domain-containing protein [Nonlabens sp.]